MQDVVHAGDDGHQVGSEGDRHRYLLLEDLPCGPAADGEVRVLDAALVHGQVLGQPVGPAAVATVVVVVSHAFGAAVTDRHVAMPTPGRLAGLRLVRAMSAVALGRDAPAA